MNQSVDNAIGGYEHGGAGILSKPELAMLLQKNAEPRPKAERRVITKPINHADRRKEEVV